MRLIDADRLLEQFDIERKYLIERGQIGAEHILVHSFRDLVLNAQTVEPIRECRYKDRIIYGLEVDFEKTKEIIFHTKHGKTAKFVKASAEPEKRWIPCTKGGLPLTELGRREKQKWFGYKCSKCKFIYKGNALTESPFCQNCGAKMVEPQESEE